MRLAALTACLSLMACGSIPGVTPSAQRSLAPTAVPSIASEGPAVSTGSGPRCPLDPHLVPACGALWGITPPKPTYASLKASEVAVGRHFDFMNRFHDLNDRIPDKEDQQVLASGSILHIEIDARVYGKPEALVVPWWKIAAGTYDSALLAQARGIAAINNPVFVTFDHEPDQPKKSVQGSAADYIAAWRHVHQLYDMAGANNAVWVWVATGWMPSAAEALKMWPGNDFVDWISWEAYDSAGCRNGAADASRSKPFSDVGLSFYRYLLAQGPVRDIDVTKPMMISEAGSAIAANSSETSVWYRQIPTVIAQYPRIKAVGLWDHGDRLVTCNYTFSTIPSRAEDVQQASRARWVNPLSRN